MSELIKRLEARENDFRRKVGNAKRNGDVMLEKYYQGHVHEIESLLFILKEV